MKSNKFISVILSLAMLMSICGIQPIASAYDDTTTGMSTQRADVSYVYLGKSTPINETTKLGDFPGQTPKDIDTNLDVGEVVWIGVQMSNMTRVKDLLDRNSSDNNSGGLGTLCLGMAYDSEYLKPVGNASSLFNTSKIRSNYPTDAEFGAYYSMTMNSDLVWSERGSEENLLDNKSTTNDVIVQVRINDQSDAVANDGDGGRGLERMFEATSNDDPVVVAAFAFKILKKPTNGLKVLQAHLAGERFTIGVGYDGASPTTQWVNDRTSDASSNLKNYFDLTNANGGVIDIFPKTCSVNFYNDDTLTAPAVKTVSVAQGNTISTDDIPTDADFSPSTGMYFKELRYTTSTTANPTSDPVFDSNTTVTDDINVYAVYEAGHTVTFNSNYPSGTQTTKDVTVSPKAGATIAETQKPTIGTSSDDFEIPAGYTFDGWFTQQNGGDKIVFDDGTNTSSATDVSSITDVYAHWVQNVTVTFHENYGQTENTTNKTISAGSSLKSSDIPTFTRADYAFKEWNTKADGSGTTYSNTQLQAETISSNTDYYAMWTPENPDNAVTLTFSPTGCDAQVTPASMTVVRGDTIYAYQMPTPTKTSATGDAYTFNGWYGAASESDTTDKAPFTLTDNKTVYAHWTYAGRDQVTVTFDYDGATSPTAPTTITVGKGDSIGDAMPTTPVKTNYSFDKWVNTADNSDFDKTTTVNSDITVKAIYKSDITVNFNINDGTTPAAPFATDKGAPSKPYTAPSDPTRANYTFVGWNTKANGSGKFITAADYATLNDVSTAAGGTNPVELYAYWADAPVTPGKLPSNETPNDNGVKVTFDSNASGSASSTVTDANPKYVYPHLGDALGTLMPEAPTRTNYKFVGWNTKADGSGTTFTDATAITTTLDGVTANGSKYNLVVYAQWDIADNVDANDKVTITFNDNKDGNGGTNIKTVTIFKGDSLGYDVTAPTNKGYTFDNWYEGTVTGGSLSMTTTAFDKTKPINSNTDYYAKWLSDITIRYDVNGGVGTYNDVVGAPTANYTDPAQNPTKTNYVFIGWNTKPNGAGNFVTSAKYPTLNDVSLAAQGSEASAPTTVTLYAYWAAANVNPGENVIPDDIPKNNGVKVTFDSNVTGNKTNAAVTDANPKYVYPYLGDALGDMMPNQPTRTHYVFKGWNTKADGSGVTVDSTTKIDQATLKDALKEIAGTNTAYETTLYAQWDIDPSVPTSDKVNVTFNKNLDLNGNDTSPRVVTLYKGDSIGYDITEPTNGTFEFDGWKTAFDGTGTKFDKDTKIDADKTYYATWFKYLKVELVNANAEYTGQVISPKYNIYQIKYDDASKTTYTKVADSDIAKNETLPAGFTATVTDKDNATTTIQNVGVYTIAISIDNAGTYANGYKIGVQDSTFEVTSAKLTVNVDPDTQKQKAGSSRKDPVITVVDATGNTVGKSEYDIKYYTWTDAGTAPDGNIQKSELSEVTDITKVGKYVVAVELKANSNYVIDSVKSTTTEAVLLYDGKTTGYAEYTDAKVGGNIVYEVLANDPSIKEIKANSVKGSTVDSTALPFKDSQYKNDVAFDNAETPAIKDYYVRVPDVDADSIQFNVTLTNPDTTTITASDGTTLTPTKNGDGTYTIKAPLTNKGQTENTITITTKAGTDNDAPTLTYTFHVQQLVEAKVELNPGNSPYGLIQRMATDVTDPWTATKIQQAKDAFNNSDATNKTYGVGLVPTNGQTTLKYTASAWEGQTKNYDTDVDAIFVYEAAQFTDPGLVVYDQTGAQIASPNVTKSLTLRKISTGVPKYTADEGTMVNVSEKLIDGVNKYDLSGAIYRPDVYELKYDIKYTDLTDGSTKHLNIIRPVIVLSKHGDVSLTTLPLLNANDASDLKNNWTTLTSRSNLFAFRTADVNITTVPLINSNDASDLKNKWTKGFDEFYTTLD
ncbi:InlB B-repeat-containing protein [Hominilimicola sp.]|uniref:InlB B-repeat-containing protein n=1 Tax=Hominilimicola sp. TaxID=3073571 RepID=UPI00399BEF72